MNNFWITFTDGSAACCQGVSPYDAAQIAEKLTGKTVVVGSNRWEPEGAKRLPYPAAPVIWQLDHPVCGKTPTFCLSPKRCAGSSACPRDYSCTE